MIPCFSTLPTTNTADNHHSLVDYLLMEKRTVRWGPHHADLAAGCSSCFPPESIASTSLNSKSEESRCSYVVAFSQCTGDGPLVEEVKGYLY